MSGSAYPLKDEFRFGTTTVQIIQGDIIRPCVEVDAIVSTDDNYLTMGGGVAARLREKAASKYYVQKAQAQCPVKAGTVVVTKPYGLTDIPYVKWVLHGTAIDYDTTDLPLGPLVGRTTANCLAEAEKRGIKRILFPAFAAGAGKLTMEECARWMCGAIKEYVAQWRPIEVIYIILGLPEPEKRTPAEKQEFVAQVQLFCREANLVLDTPCDPASGVRQCRDFYGRQVELEQLEAILTGQKDENGYKRHAVILGGPSIGKRALLDQLFCRARKAGSAIGQGRCVVMLAFGRVHENTPPSFVYRKFLAALATLEQDESLRKDIRRAYGDPDLGCTGFLEFLDRHADRYPEVVFLVDHLPRLLQMEKTTEDKSIAWFWSDLDRLQERVRFVYTARDEEYEILRRERLECQTQTFKDRIEIVRLTCLKEEERKGWVDALFRDYLECPKGAPFPVHSFFGEEAGLHPYLIGLVGHSLVKGLKRDALLAQKPIREYGRRELQSYLDATRSEIEEPRRVFFQGLLADRSLTPDERHDLEKLAHAVAHEREHRRLLPGLDRKEPGAIEQLYKLREETNPRLSLHPDVLAKLERRGYLVDTADPNKAQFMAGSFDLWLYGYFGLGERTASRPDDVFVAFLNPEPNVVTTLFGERGGRLVSARKRLSPGLKEQLMEGYRSCINHLLNELQNSISGPFADLENVANFVLTYLTTNAIKEYLRDVPKDATISLAVDEALKDIPWELMLETAYVGDTPYPFAVGRRIVSQEMPHNIRPPVGGTGKVRALLIGDPTDDLHDAAQEVRDLCAQLRHNGRFVVQDEDVRIGSEQCQLLPLLDILSSGQYGLIHYSGHSKSDGSHSAWILKDGALTVDLLTAALQNAPPTMVVSSSCQSAAGAAAQAAQYENQTFDLPSAFLQAGVVVYVGTLWSVLSRAAQRFVEGFYDAFLSGKSLGVCLRRGKRAIRGSSVRTDRLAFIMYGDPHTQPDDLFSVMRNGE